jgi:pyruvate,water dikinase
MAPEPQIIWLQDCAGDCAPLVGGKAHGLGTLLREGFRVPPGFAITTDAYREHVAHNNLRAVLSPERTAEDIRNAFEHSRPSPQLAEAVLAAHEQLGGSSQPVAVRSSATAEDLADASFAGQQETYLWLLGGEQVLQHVLRCWGSLFTEQAVAYRAHLGVPFEDLAMAVVVQQMVPAEVAGVMLTIDPVTGDRSVITIEAAYGLGAAVVNGEVTPDRFVVDKATLQIRTRAMGDKHMAYRFDPSIAGTRFLPVPPQRQRVACMSDEEVIALAQLGQRMEHAMGDLPQDLEWAIGPTREIFLLQARPETVWSQQPSSPPAAAAGGTPR